LAKRTRLLQSDGLRLRRGQRVLLDGLDLRLAAGELAVLWVEGRDGPTTIAEGLAGAGRLHVEAGSLCVRNQDVTALDFQQRSRQGLLLVDPGRVVPGVTVTNHVRIAGREQDEELGSQELRRRLLEALDVLELDGHFAGRTLPEDPPFLDRLRLVLLTVAVVRPAVALVPIDPESVDLDVVRLLVRGFRAIDRSASAVLVLTRNLRLSQELDADQKWSLQQGRIQGRVPEKQEESSSDA